MAARTAEPQPLSAINITPLIDVMIITLPTSGGKVTPAITHRLDIAASDARPR